MPSGLHSRLTRLMTRLAYDTKAINLSPRKHTPKTLSMQTIQWRCQNFDDLSTSDLFTILKLRQDVFVVEQACAYPDIDDVDLKAMHLSAWSQDSLIAYARLMAPGLTYAEASIGRVLVAREARGKHLAQQLMQRALSTLAELYPEAPIKLGAQEYLLSFYTRLGFSAVSDVYLEDGIPHLDMLKAPAP